MAKQMMAALGLFAERALFHKPYVPLCARLAGMHGIQCRNNLAENQIAEFN